MMGKIWRTLPHTTAALLLLFFASFINAQEQTKNESEIDAFMRKAIETRSKDWDKRYDYVFREVEELKISGDIGDAPFAGFVKEWSWYVKDGYLVRSPISVDGMPVSDEERERSERRWIKSLQKQSEKGKQADENQFFGFKFKPGNYFFAGREQIDGHDVVVIDYYPNKRLTERDIRRAEKNDDFDVQVEKALAVTLYADVNEPRIVRMVMHNTGMDFLPGQALVKVLDVQAIMQMFENEGGDWLPKEIYVGGVAATASGEINVSYVRRFDDYRKAKVKVQFRFAPKTSGGEENDDEKP